MRVASVNLRWAEDDGNVYFVHKSEQSLQEDLKNGLNTNFFHSDSCFFSSCKIIPTMKEVMDGEIQFFNLA